MDPNTGAAAYMIAGGANGSNINGGPLQGIALVSVVSDFDFGKLSLLSDIFDVVKALIECVAYGGDKNTIIDLSIRLFFAVVIVSLLTLLLTYAIATGALIAGIALSANAANLIGFFSAIFISAALAKGGWKFPSCSK